MKLQAAFIAVTVCATLALVCGCKKEEPAPGADATKASEPGVVDAAKSAAGQVVSQVTTQAAAQVGAAQQQAQGVIDQAKAYVADKKYQDALNSLTQLANTKLTPEQQQTVDNLKAQIQAALAKVMGTDPAAGLGGVLGGKQ